MHFDFNLRDALNYLRRAGIEVFERIQLSFHEHLHAWEKWISGIFIFINDFLLKLKSPILIYKSCLWPMMRKPQTCRNCCFWKSSGTRKRSTPFSTSVWTPWVSDTQYIIIIIYNKGSKFISNNASTLEEVYQDTDYKTPLIFILSPGLVFLYTLS